MNDNMKISNGFQNDLSNRDNSIDKEDLTKLNNLKFIKSNFDNNSIIFQKNIEDKKEDDNNFDDFFINKNYNIIVSYYYQTARFLQDSKVYKNISKMNNSKNFIPKIKNNNIYRNINKDNKYNEEYINKNQQRNNCIYDYNNHTFNNFEQQINYITEYNNYLISQELIHRKNKVNKNINNINNVSKEKNILKGYLENKNLIVSNNIINNIDCPPFIPSNYNIQQKEDILRNKSKDSLSKDKESDSTSAISEKREEENNLNNFDSPQNLEKRKNSENLEKVEYLVEMFGRKGWICKLCNNFNYETRSKCNRCGIIKKPKKIIDLKSKIEHKDINYNNIHINKERNNKKGDWICINCRNLNYSFRTVCNRCKIPKINPFLNNANILNNKAVNNIQKYPFYSFSPPIIFFNNNV